MGDEQIESKHAPAVGRERKILRERGVEFVEVEDEPVHVEQLRNAYVRVYKVSIAPGSVTLYHRHRKDTLYVVLQGGYNISDEPFRQRQRMPGLPRSLRLRTRLTMAFQRLSTGAVNIPTATCVMQYHESHPLIHRVCAPSSNQQALSLLGIEILPRDRARTASVDRSPLDAHGFTLEYRDARVRVHRLRLGPGEATGVKRVEPPALIVPLRGRFERRSAVDRARIDPGHVHWLPGHTSLELVNVSALQGEMLLVALL
ncbi:MAG TPA: hypothetical protein VFN67_40710 [Polyangiales bacterium]|nr:hypothetical protein [Polyangiales bacterium]